FAEQVTLYGDEATAWEIVRLDHENALQQARGDTVVRFLVPPEFSWSKIRHHPVDTRLGEFITQALRETAKQNPELQGVLDAKDFNERQAGQRILDDDRLHELIEVISRHRLGHADVAPDLLGQAYEYL